MKPGFKLLFFFTILFAACEESAPPGPPNNGGGNNSNCPPTVTDIDGNVYNVVSIGNQCWMKENLKTTKYRNGDDLITDLNDVEWASTVDSAWANYNNNIQFDNIYGKLYNFPAIADSRGLCPTGWHVPTDSEWHVLIKHLDAQADTSQNSSNQSLVAGGLMKSVGDLQSGTGYWEAPNTGATNSSNFSGVPGGYRDFNLGFQGLGIYGYWWSSSATTTDNAWGRELFFSNSNANRGNYNQRTGKSLRCIKD